MSKNIVVIYHANCLDGFGAAYVAWRYFDNRAEYIAANYNELPPCVDGKDVYILDFSYKKEVLASMIAVAKSLLVIDHHKTAEAELVDFPDNTIFSMEESGAVLTWKYFYPRLPIPMLLEYIQDRDLWKFNFSGTRPLTAALYSLIKFDFQEWHNICNNHSVLTNCMKKGQALLQVMETDLAALNLQRHTVTVTLYGEETPGFACNSVKYTSELGNLLAKESGTFGLVYYYDGAIGLWKYSLRSIGDFDVSEIAKNLGGGGHKNAAGFTSVNLISF